MLSFYHPYRILDQFDPGLIDSCHQLNYGMFLISDYGDGILPLRIRVTSEFFFIQILRYTLDSMKHNDIRYPIFVV